MEKIKSYIIDNKKQIFSNLIVIFLLFMFYRIIQCPVKTFTGICCPGCGMTRACFSLFKLDFKEAFHYHPGVFLMPFAVTGYILRKKIPKKILNIFTVLFCLIFIVIYIYRLYVGSDVIYIDFERGLIYKFIDYIKHIF